MLGCLKDDLEFRIAFETGFEEIDIIGAGIFDDVVGTIIAVPIFAGLVDDLEFGTGG